MPSSQMLRSAKNAEVAATETRQAIIRSRVNSVEQWSKGISASPNTIVPGSSTVININFASPNYEEEIKHFLQYDVYNAHVTDSITFKTGPLAHWGNIQIQPNNSDQLFEVDKYVQMKELAADKLLDAGLTIYEEGSFYRNEFDTYNGITIGPQSSKTFYFPLDYIVSYAGTCIKGAINTLTINLTALQEQGNFAAGGRYYACSSTNNLWTAANIQIKNINYVRHFCILNDPNQINLLFNSLQPVSTPVRHIHWLVQEKVMYTGPMMAGQISEFKLSDIYKSSKIQFVAFAARNITTAWNDPECCKEYSGYNYLGYDWRQLNTGGDEKELDMTDPLRLREKELQQYRNTYGRKQLPQAIMNDPTNLMMQYYLHRTVINFDVMQEENAHEVLRYTNSITQDYDITIKANANIGTNCELRAYMVIAKEFEWNRQTGQLTLVVS